MMAARVSFMSATRVLHSLDEAGDQPIMRFWSPPVWPDDVTPRGGSPNSLVVRQALLEYDKQFVVIGDS